MLYQINDGTVSLGGNVILDHIDFEIRGTEKIAVAGANGAGKTTLLQVLSGELGLDGTVRGIPGVMALTAQARESGFRRVFLPAENVKEASFIGGISLYGVRDL